jgi:hypothetical protein
MLDRTDPRAADQDVDGIGRLNVASISFFTSDDRKCLCG